MTSIDTLLIVLSSLLHTFVNTSLSPIFYSWLNETYSTSMADRLLRDDLGPGGSFGGGKHIIGQKTKHEPLILVHGITNRIDLFLPIRQYFLKHGYNDEEVYGTTYGDAGRTSIFFDTMKCDYAKRIRELIQSVSAYTLSKVDVIAYSMGSPIARKAIMGGACVEEPDEQLGGSLTELVDTFVSVAGANFGSFLCLLPFGSCNILNGMHCWSKFLVDINSKTHYEGHHVFTIYSQNDDKVGYYTCGKLASGINGADGYVEESGMDHTAVMMNTVQKQFNLVSKHRP